MTTTADPDGANAAEPDQPAPPSQEPVAGAGSNSVTVRTEELAKALGEAFDGFDTRMQALTADLDPDNVRTAGAMALETGMYANSLAKIVNDLIAAVHQLAAEGGSASPDPTGQDT